CAVYNAASEISNCQNGKVTFAAQTCNGSNCISSASDGPPQYIDKSSGGCAVVPANVDVLFSAIMFNLLCLFIPLIFIGYLKKKRSKGAL
ncbi:MAG: hypothetical protein M1332_06740, partial [Deltaproteobacteria bacterium]|nr:hypothetical protein [Deltaproteobacteria bacterium]